MLRGYMDALYCIALRDSTVCCLVIVEEAELEDEATIVGARHKTCNIRSIITSTKRILYYLDEDHAIASRQLVTTRRSSAFACYGHP
jgi:hypothetical protein